jgi:TRAP-type C4-dicarboxylate transport system permease small subunit
METLDKAVDRLANAVERVLAVALVAAVSLNFINVIGRYLAGFTLTGVDEVEIYILISIAFLGAAVVFWRNEHLRMDVLLNACPAVLRKAVLIVEMAVMLAVALVVAVQSFLYVERIHALGAVSDIAHVPTWIPHSAIFLSFGAMAVMVVLRGIRVLRGAADVRQIGGGSS